MMHLHRWWLGGHQGPIGLEVAVDLLQHAPQRSHLLEAVGPRRADVLDEGGQQLLHPAHGTLTTRLA